MGIYQPPIVTWPRAKFQFTICCSCELVRYRLTKVLINYCL